MSWQERAVDGGAGVVGWLLEHGAVAFWVVVAVATAIVLVRVAYNVALAWADLRLRHRAGDAAGALTDWLGARGPDGRSAFYHAYLASPEWAARSKRTLTLAGGTCQRCGRARAREAHHLTYERLGHEADADLLAVCVPCHLALHGRR
jgi:hypothetical protein